MRSHVILIFLVFLLAGCVTKNVVCSTPYILVGEQCCMDKNGDSICDEQQKLSDLGSKRLVPSESLPDVVLERPVEQPAETKQAQPATRIPVNDDLMRGDLNAKVKLVEFGDYYDLFSQRFNNEVLPEILERYGDNVLYIFRDFPASENIYRNVPALAANCANEQGKFWEYHNILFADLNKLGPESLQQDAKDIGLDAEKFDKCLKAKRYTSEVIEDLQSGRSYGVSSTPTIFVNGEKVVGFRNFNYFKEVLDRLLATELASKVEDRKEITVDATGRAYLIQEGETVLDSNVKNSMYTNKIEFADALLYLAAEDVTIGGKTYEDSATMTLRVKMKKYMNPVRTEYTVKLKSLVANEQNHGGISTNALVFGDTGILTNLLPKVRAQIALFGKSDVIDQKNRVVATNLTTYLFVTPGLREGGLLIGNIDEKDNEAYLIIPGKFIGEQFPYGQGFLHIFFENVNYKVA